MQGFAPEARTKYVTINFFLEMLERKWATYDYRKQ